MSAGWRSLGVNVGIAAGADTTGGGAGEGVFGPVFSVVDSRRSLFHAMGCDGLLTGFSVESGGTGCSAFAVVGSVGFGATAHC